MGVIISLYCRVVFYTHGIILALAGSRNSSLPVSALLSERAKIHGNILDLSRKKKRKKKMFLNILTCGIDQFHLAKIRFITQEICNK